MQAGISPLIKTLYVRCKSSPRELNARSRLADVRVAEYLTKNEKAPRLVEKSLGELHIMGRKNWRVQKMGYTKMNRHNYPDIEGLTEAERAKLDHIDDIEDDLADAYDSTATYAVGDWCIRNGKLYECITAITTAEPFDSTKWRRVAVAELKSNLSDLITYSQLTSSNHGKVKFANGLCAEWGTYNMANITTKDAATGTYKVTIPFETTFSGDSAPKVFLQEQYSGGNPSSVVHSVTNTSFTAGTSSNVSGIWLQWLVIGHTDV